ncbi:conserved hypothetical protein [delta proteobacterium NaphS2]|nr:conserved hypothetical protein [delta proteobacterium NaphS2]
MKVRRIRLGDERAYLPEGSPLDNSVESAFLVNFSIENQ